MSEKKSSRNENPSCPPEGQNPYGEKPPKKHRRHHHPIRKLIFLLIIIVLIAFGLWVSPWGGNSLGWFPEAATGSAANEATTAAASEADSKADTKEAVIIVKGGEIQLDNTEVSLDSLKDYLSKTDGNTSIIVHDEQAIKATYESVTSLLDELKLTYTEK